MNPDYPANRIFVIYGLFGSLIGIFFTSLFSNLGFDPLVGYRNHAEFSLYNLIIGTIGMWLIGGWWVGLLPALITAFIIIIKLIVIKNFSSYIKIFAIGFLVTMLFFIKIPFIGDFDTTTDFFMNELEKLAFNSCGGFSAVICGFFSLPRQNKEM